ncbi:FliI/YscN family ATPase [Gallaecimonas pentaromativorans]|uniref:FliI/YscN family ATPase n=1 Tax=Gallaecimonas pentaromativorans TaxID=584787 RepID=UPI00067F076A|nr:FliI/YscN family ATPase [Gallaecimonas pentaromativorans]MED5526528.1 FliI/YscN family ATPase [Pseudomonadota bacterium]
MTALSERLSRAAGKLGEVELGDVAGRLVRVTGLTLEVVGCRLVIGQRCLVDTKGSGPVLAEVVGFDRETAFLMPYRTVSGLYSGASVRPLEDEWRLPVGPALLGRVLDGMMQPLDGGPPPVGELISLNSQPLNPLVRAPIKAPLDVGVRALNALLTPGKGQRLGIFAGPGVGKSVLMGMMTRYTQAQVVIVGLIGERGREVREFIEDALGPEGLSRAVVIAAPADQSPLLRLRAAEVCHRLAEYYRDQGQDVLLLMDSFTRYAQAQRELALAIGEPPATRGYPPSVFAALTRLAERAGNGSGTGSLSAFYTVLSEGDDQQDPVSDAARAILDGHIVLSRSLAEAGHYPAIDINASISRVMQQVTDGEHRQWALRLKRLLSRYQQVRELLPLGGYQPGQDPELDESVRRYPAIAAFLQQDTHQAADFAGAVAALKEVFS